MIINHDYSDFNPDGFSLPPVGRFLQRVIDEKFAMKSEEKGGYAFLTLTFVIEEGVNKGTKYNLDYLTGHPNVQTNKIAKESLGRIYLAVTGQMPPKNGFDTALLQKAPFYGTISHEESPKKDGSGVYKNARLNNIESANVAAQQQPAQAAVNAAPASTAPWVATQ